MIGSLLVLLLGGCDGNIAKPPNLSNESLAILRQKTRQEKKENLINTINKKSSPQNNEKNRLVKKDQTSLAFNGKTVKLANAFLAQALKPFKNQLAQITVLPEQPGNQTVPVEIQQPSLNIPNLVGILYDVKQPLALLAFNDSENTRIVGKGQTLEINAGLLCVEAIREETVDVSITLNGNKELTTLKLPDLSSERNQDTQPQEIQVQEVQAQPQALPLLENLNTLQ